MSNQLNTKKDMLMENLKKFFKVKKNFKILKDIIEGKNTISLRVIDWFVTNYCKKYNIKYKLKKNELFMVHLDYKCQLKSFKKKLFDPFRRKDKIEISFDENNIIFTTVGQLNFFKWALKNKVIDYIQNNLNEIEKDMTKRHKKKENKLKREITLSATKTVNKHYTKIIVSFD
jgi:hypothetical protein